MMMRNIFIVQTKTNVNDVAHVNLIPLPLSPMSLLNIYFYFLNMREGSSRVKLAPTCILNLI